MLNKIEMAGVEDILKELQHDELISLAETVTKKQVKLTRKNGMCLNNTTQSQPAHNQNGPQTITTKCYIYRLGYFYEKYLNKKYAFTLGNQKELLSVRIASSNHVK